MHDRSISARPRWATAAALALAISFGAAGCGSDDPTSSGDSDTTVIGDVDSAAADAFCQSTDALNTQISSVAAAGGDLSTFAGAVDAINTSGNAVVSAEPGAAPTVRACMESVSAALAAAANGTSPASTLPGDTPGDTPTTVAGDTPTTVAGDTPTSDNPAVAEFCSSADRLADGLAKVMADPASGDVAALTAQALQLSTDATALITANPADAAAITACVQAITDALVPGGVTPTVPAPPGGDTPGPTMDVDTFCTQAAELGQALKDAIANPADADVAGISARAQELVGQVQALITAHPQDAARISECVLSMNPT